MLGFLGVILIYKEMFGFHPLNKDRVLGFLIDNKSENELEPNSI